MDPAATCPFCSRIGSGDVDAENELAAAFPDAFPVSPGHTLVVPKRHLASYFDLPREEQHAIWELVSEVQARMDRDLSSTGYNVGINVGAPGGQTVWHAHVHVIPRYSGDVEDPRGGVRRVVPSKAAYWKKSR